MFLVQCFLACIQMKDVDDSKLTNFVYYDLSEYASSCQLVP